MTTSTDLKRNLTLALDGLLRLAVTPEEEVVISLNGSFGEAIVVTDRRAIVLREATTIGAAQKDQVFAYPLTDVQSATMSASDVAGQLILEIADAEGRAPLLEKRSVGFPVADFEIFEKAAAEIERLAAAAREKGKEEPAAMPAGEAETLTCGSCGAAVRRSYLYCPACGGQLWTLCAGCNAPIEDDWRFCAICGRDLSGQSADPRAMRRVLTMHARRGTSPPSATQRPEAPAPEEIPELTQPAAETDSAEQMNRRGVELYEQGELEQAIASFQQAIQLDSTKGKFYTNLGVAYGDADQAKEAKQAYQTAIRLNPDDPAPLLYLGGLLAEDDDHAGARELWERVIAIAPNTPEAREARNNLIGLDNL
jgi:tetratricopeptide (TPR) repeat protein